MARIPLACAALLLFVGSSFGQLFVYKTKNLNIRKDQRFFPIGKESVAHFSMLYKGIDFGGNYVKPPRPLWGDPHADFSRLPLTYYWPTSPVGIALKKFDWFRGPLNTYHSDARMPASLAGLGAATLGGNGLPVAMLTGLWSEPPVAVLGGSTGALASYARPYQHFDFFEHNKQFAKLAKGHKGFFHYVKDAKKRGAKLRFIEGDHRKNFAKYGPRGFYHLISVEANKDCIEVIHKELLTKEGMKMLVERLAPGGVLCYHISSQHYDLVPVITDVANSLRLVVRQARDMAPNENAFGANMRKGHYSSTWVMVGRSPKYLAHLQDPPRYQELMEKWLGRFGDAMWQVSKATGKYVWTDKHQRMSGLYRSDPTVGAWKRLVYRFEDVYREKYGELPLVTRFTTQLVTGGLDILSRITTEMKNRPVQQK